MTKYQRAEILIIELSSLANPDEAATVANTLVLLNETLKDAKLLAEEVLKEKEIYSVEAA